MHIASKTYQRKAHRHMATNGGLSAKPIATPCTYHKKHKTKTKLKQTYATDGGLSAEPIKRSMHATPKTQTKQNKIAYRNALYERSEPTKVDIMSFPCFMRPGRPKLDECESVRYPGCPGTDLDHGKQLKPQQKTMTNHRNQGITINNLKTQQKHGKSFEHITSHKKTTKRIDTY